MGENEKRNMKSTPLSGAGTVDDPVLISNAEEMDRIRDDLSAYYRLTEDIDFEDHLITPIGTNTAPFTGGLDGAGHAIKNFRICVTTAATHYTGLFGYAKSAVLKDLALENAEVRQESTGSYTGALAGNLWRCQVQDIRLKDITVYGYYDTGGLAGNMDGNLTGCRVGGNSRITGHTKVGGLVGFLFNSSNRIKECCVEAEVEGQDKVGGLIGQLNGTITDCFAVGSVTSATESIETGGLTGYANTATIENCFAACKVSRNGSGLMYHYRNSKVTNSYFDSLRAETSASNLLNLPKLTPALIRKDFFPHWDFETVWDMNEGSSYPYLRSIGKTAGAEAVAVDITAGMGTEDSPYLIGSPEALDCIRYELDGCYKLSADIDMNGYLHVPIGTSAAPFTGTFDGAGYTIKNLRIIIEDAAAKHTGLFAYARNAVFQNLFLKKAEVKHTANGSYTGVLAGYLKDCQIQDIHLKDIIVSAADSTGGLAGFVEGSLTGCSVSGNSSVTGRNSVGGLVGYLSTYSSVTITSQIKECCAEGSIAGETSVGGLAGGAYGTVTDCFAIGSVTSIIEAEQTGGLVGNADKASINKCYAACKVSKNGSGLVYNYRSSTVTYSYFDSLAAKESVINANNVPKLTAAMFQKECFTYFDFKKVWNIREGSSYPYLRCIGRIGKGKMSAGEITEGLGTMSRPYLIGTPGGLECIRYILTGYFRLTADIDLAGRLLSPIGSYIAPFKGGLDGAGHSIMNMHIEITDNASYTGLFGNAITASFQDLVLEKAVVRLDGTGSYTGALAGYSRGCQIQNIRLKDITVSGADYTGGLAGFIEGNVVGCSVCGNSSVSGKRWVGGITGKMSTGSTASVGYQIKESCAEGNIFGEVSVGGLVGSSDSNITDCYAACSVTSATEDSYTGGLVGFVSNATIKNSYAACTVSKNGSGLAYCYSSVIVTSSFFNSTLTGLTTPAAQAKTAGELLEKKTYAGWNWTGIWVFREGDSPALKAVSLGSMEPFELTLQQRTSDTAAIAWPEIPEAKEYNVFYGSKNVKTSAPVILLEGLNPDTEYLIQVQAKISDTIKRWSKTMAVRTKRVLMVDGLHCTEKGTDTIKLSWNPVEGAAGYEVQYNGQVRETATNTYELTGLIQDMPYEVRVGAIMGDGSKVTSAPVMVNRYHLIPQTDYAGEFIRKCEGQGWFIDEIENLLNRKGKSVNTIASRADLGTIYAIGLSGRGISGTIPAAIGELTQLRYLYLDHNELGGQLPGALEDLPELLEMDLSGNHFSAT